MDDLFDLNWFGTPQFDFGIVLVRDVQKYQNSHSENVSVFIQAGAKLFPMRILNCFFSRPVGRPDVEWKVVTCMVYKWYDF